MDWPINGDGQRTATYAVNILVTNGIQISSGSAAGTYGSWLPMTAASDFDATGFFFSTVAFGAAADYSVDIGVGAAAAEKTIVQKLYFNSTGSANYGGNRVWIPIVIPAGTRISVRCSSSLVATSATMTCILTIVGQGFRPSRSLSSCITYNMPGTLLDGESTSGVPTSSNYCDSSAADLYGPFIDITAIASPATTTLIRPIQAAMFAFVPKTSDASAETARWLVNIAVGATEGTVASPYLIEDIVVQNNTADDRFNQPFFGPVPLSLPAGARVQANIKPSNSTVGRRELGVILYGFS